MKFPKDHCLVDIDEKQNLKKTIKTAEGEKELILDVAHNRIEDDFIPEDDTYIPQKGTIISVPGTTNTKARKVGITPDLLSDGDVVYMHHLAVRSERKLTNGQYFLSLPRDLGFSITTNFLCKIKDGDIEPIFDWNFCKPVKNVFAETTLIIPEYLRKQKREDVLQIVRPSAATLSNDTKQGDTIIVDKNSIYPIRIEGEDYIAVRDENILLKVID